MPQKIAPSAVKAQEPAALLQGQTEASSGEEFLSILVQLATERMLQETLEQAQAEVLGRSRYERRGATSGYRNGYEEGPSKRLKGSYASRCLKCVGWRNPIARRCGRIWRRRAIGSRL